MKGMKKWVWDGSDVYLLALYPSPELNDHTKYLIDESYKSLSRAYQCNVYVAHDISEFLDLRSMPYVSLEGPNDVCSPITDFAHPPKAVYLTGNSVYTRISYHIECEHRIHIPVVKEPHQLYGFQAAAIALHDRLMKNGD